jgi:hypothetical protein
MKTPGIIVAALLAFTLASCEEKPSPAPAPASSPAPSASPAPVAVPSAEPAPARPVAPEGGNTVPAAGLTFTVPEGWQVVPPSNTMRLAEVLVPDASGNSADACTIAFSTAGGDVQANIDRWAGQVHGQGGKPAVPTIQKATVSGMSVTIAEMTGAYAGMGQGPVQENWTLRGAMVETADGLLFIKMTGPAGPMSDASGGFAAMIQSMRKG